MATPTLTLTPAAGGLGRASASSVTSTSTLAGSGRTSSSLLVSCGRQRIADNLSPQLLRPCSGRSMVNVSCYDDEFPLLEALGLYAAQTEGAGNCLFNAFSDQLYGNEDSHREIRLRVVEHLRSNANHYKSFIDVAPVRRVPRRRAAAASGNARSDAPLSASEIEKAFEARLQRMEKNGVFGDNLEIQAFAREYGVHVKVYHQDYAYVIRGEGGKEVDDEDVQVVHIAYHTWEHFSSIRNRTGPHTGPPNVSPLTPSPSASAAAAQKIASLPKIQPWMENAVSSSLPYPEDPQKIRSVLEHFKCDVNASASHLIELWERSQFPSSSAPSSSSSSESASGDSRPGSPVLLLQVPTPENSDGEEEEEGGKRRRSPDGTVLRIASGRNTPEVGVGAVCMGVLEAEEGGEADSDSGKRKRPGPDAGRRLHGLQVVETLSNAESSDDSAARMKAPLPRRGRRGARRGRRGGRGGCGGRTADVRKDGNTNGNGNGDGNEKKDKDPATVEKVTTGIRELYV